MVLLYRKDWWSDISDETISKTYIESHFIHFVYILMLFACIICVGIISATMTMFALTMCVMSYIFYEHK